MKSVLSWRLCPLHLLSHVLKHHALSCCRRFQRQPGGDGYCGMFRPLAKRTCKGKDGTKICYRNTAKTLWGHLLRTIGLNQVSMWLFSCLNPFYGTGWYLHIRMDEILQVCTPY